MDIDFGTKELLHSTPMLRDDILFSHQVHDETDVYIIEDPIQSKYYRIGLPEYRFISLLNGRNTVGQSLSQVAKDLGDDALSEHEAAVVLDWLLESELALPSSGIQQHALDDKRQKTRDASSFKYLNLLFLKVPLFNPERFLTIIMPAFSWMLGLRFFGLWLFVILSGLYQVIVNAERFTVSGAQLFSVDNWLWLFCAWIILKIVHELFHGLVCKKYDGHVYEAGIIWILFAPIGYVDATSSWMLGSKWKRMHTAAAGMYIELFVAGIFAWVWAYSEPGPFRELSYNIIVLASVTTLLFNANPLMKFDGYYIFSDFVEMPNLYQDGSAYMKFLGKKYLLGVRTSFPSRSAKQDIIVRIYGICSFFWRIIIMVTLLIIANHLFHGAGALLVILSLIMLVGVPLIKLFKYVREGNAHEQPNPLGFLLRVTLLFAVVFLVFTQFTFTKDVAAPLVVDYKKVNHVFSSSNGFIQRYLVEDGQYVEENQAIIKLENTQIDAEISAIQLKLQQMNIQRNTLFTRREIASLQALDERIEALKSELMDKEEAQQNLVVRSKASGQVVLPNTQGMLGRFVDRNTVLAKVVSDKDKNIILAVNQSNFNQLQNKKSAFVDIYIHGRPKMQGLIEDVSQKASTYVRFPQLTSLGGGVIPALQDNNSAQKLRFVEPHFEVKVNSDKLTDVFVGEVGWVEFSGDETSLLVFWQQKINHWVDSVLAQI
ncbi:MAG: hypothetical protein ACRBEE_12080 [Arenicella sp.]